MLSNIGAINKGYGVKQQSSSGIRVWSTVYIVPNVLFYCSFDKGGVAEAIGENDARTIIYAQCPDDLS